MRGALHARRARGPRTWSALPARLRRRREAVLPGARRRGACCRGVPVTGGIPPGYVSVAGLKRSGWTDGLIRKLLGEPDRTARNPKFRRAAPMRLYRISRVKEAEGRPEFANKASSEPRRAAAAKAVRTKTEKIRLWASTIPIDCNFPASVDTAIRRGRATAHLLSDPSDGRAAVNYLRHECTTYDAHLAESFGAVGTSLAHAIIKNRILERISISFPELAAEAKLQMIDEAGLEPPSARGMSAGRPDT